MRSLRLFAPACFMAALLFGGMALDNAMASDNVPAAVFQFCAGAPVAGCPVVVPCPAGGGNCPGGAPPYTNFGQQSFNWVPCSAVAGVRCPNPLNVWLICTATGYTLNAAGGCVPVCAWSAFAAGC